MKNLRKMRGITLIALVVTIILLLILAGISIQLIGGSNGILGRASSAVDKNRLETAKEQVELLLGEYQTDFLNAKYVEKTEDGEKREYIKQKLSEGAETQDYYVKAFENDTVKLYEGKNSSGAILASGVILLDGSIEWDKEVLEGEENGNIQIVANQSIASDFVKGSLNVEITYEGSVREIAIKGQRVEVPEAENGVYRVSQEIFGNGNYVIVVRDENGDYKKENVKVTGITEDMEIWNKADMEVFRDKVNEGRTFEGRTVRVMEEIDLEGSEANQWVPIGNYSSNVNLMFKGIFEGNYHTIRNVFINSSKDYQGLFGINYGVIQNLKVEGNVKSTGNYIGGVVGRNWNKILNCCNGAYVQGNTDVGGITGNNSATIERCCNMNEIYATYANAGGISGGASGDMNMKECYNTGYIHANSTSAGGMIGYHAKGKIINCYNIGNIYADSASGGISGAAGVSGAPTAYSYNCYNLGSVSGSRNKGLITGFPNVNGGTSRDVNCYTTNATVDLLNAGEYSENVWTEDIGINNGYPILKWQREEK